MSVPGVGPGTALSFKAGVDSDAISELKGFAHALAHDLKQPIVAVQWFSSALDHAIARRDSAKSAHLNDRIKAAGLRMLEYVDALLSLAETSQAALQTPERAVHRSFAIPSDFAGSPITSESCGPWCLGTRS
jgi:signal transduction histidine kinase